MRLLLSLLSEHYSNVKDMLSGNVLEGLEDDKYAAVRLQSYLLLRNSRRILILSVFQILLGVVSFIVSLVGMGEISSGRFLSAIGSILLFGAGVCFFAGYYRELERRQQDCRRLGAYFYWYWGFFLCGGITLAVGEYQAAHTVFVFCVFFTVVQVVPIFKIHESLCAAAIFAVPAVLYGVMEKQGFGFYAVLLFFALAAVWISAEKYSCYAGMWISERQLELAAERSQQISHTDPLTGMLNKAGLTAKFYELYANTAEIHKAAVLLIDIDNFRQYNHQYGYDESDRCLYRICNCIRIFAKPITELISRFGGDDFVLILEDMSEIEVVRFAEQIRQGVETMALPLGEKGIVTISVGISGIVELKGKETYSALLNEADLQLMIAKKNGKNCVGYRGRAFICEERRMTR